MNNLKITQSNQAARAENVTSQIVANLYNAVYPNTPSELKGYLKVWATKKPIKDYLESRYEDLTIEATTTYISFEDPAVEELLIPMVSSGGIGITQQDVDDFNSANKQINIQNNNDIVNFKESRYFKNLYLANCENLESVGWGTKTFNIRNDGKLPKLKNIFVYDMLSYLTHAGTRWNSGTQPLIYCNSLIKSLFDAEGNHIVNVVMPDEFVQHVEENVYWQTPALAFTDIETLKINSSCVNMPTVENCTSLTSIDFSNASSMIRLERMSGCESLTLDLSTIPNTVTNVRGSLTDNYPTIIGNLRLPNLESSFRLVDNGNSNFGNCRAVDLGKLTSFGTDFFRGAYFKSIVIPATVTTISGRAMNFSEYVICLPTTPPVSGEYSINPSMAPYIFVPDEALATYQADSTWSSGNLHALSEFDTMSQEKSWN